MRVGLAVIKKVLLLFEPAVEGERVRACEGELVVEGLAVLPAKREVVVVNEGVAMVNGGAVVAGGSGSVSGEA